MFTEVPFASLLLTNFCAPPPMLNSAIVPSVTVTAEPASVNRATPGFSLTVLPLPPPRAETAKAVVTAAAMAAHRVAVEMMVRLIRTLQSERICCTVPISKVSQFMKAAQKSMGFPAQLSACMYRKLPYHGYKFHQRNVFNFSLKARP